MVGVFDGYYLHASEQLCGGVEVPSHPPTPSSAFPKRLETAHGTACTCERADACELTGSEKPRHMLIRCRDGGTAEGENWRGGWMWGWKEGKMEGGEQKNEETAVEGGK